MHSTGMIVSPRSDPNSLNASILLIHCSCMYEDHFGGVKNKIVANKRSCPLRRCYFSLFLDAFEEDELLILLGLRASRIHWCWTPVLRFFRVLFLGLHIFNILIELKHLVIMQKIFLSFRFRFRDRRDLV